MVDIQKQNIAAALDAQQGGLLGRTHMQPLVSKETGFQ
jgi:hypothetical protein